MRVIVFVKATADSEAGIMPTTEEFEAMGRFNEALIDAGIMEGGEGLHPSSKGTRVVFDGSSREVVHGPFPVDEVVAGFWLWKVKDMAEAVEWLKRCPNPMRGRSAIEIRPMFEIEDFGEAVSPEVAAHDEKLRQKLADRN